VAATTTPNQRPRISQPSVRTSIELIAAQPPQILVMRDASDGSQVRSCSREPPRGDRQEWLVVRAAVGVVLRGSRWKRPLISLSCHSTLISIGTWSQLIAGGEGSQGLPSMTRGWRRVRSRWGSGGVEVAVQVASAGESNEGC
jgi:hypothetical protein